MSITTIENAVRALYAAMLAHDIATLEGLLSDDAVYIHSTGLAETKTEFLNGARDGLYEYEKVWPTAQTILPDADLAVVYDILDFRGGPRGVIHPPVRLMTTLIWIRASDSWRLRLRQATRIP